MPASGGLVLREFIRGPAAIDADGPAVSVVDGAVTDFDVRWDETGDWLAVWIADATDPVDRPAEPRPPRPGDRPSRPAARRPAGRHRRCPGFSIADGRLAWATPPGQGGEGSRVQIVAWSDDGVGTRRERPGRRTSSSSADPRRCTTCRAAGRGSVVSVTVSCDPAGWS